MADMQTDPYTAGNQSAQASMYRNKPTDDASTALGVNPPTVGNNRSGDAQSETDEIEDQLHYATGTDWSHFYACDNNTNQGQWNNFTSVNNLERGDLSVFNTTSEDGTDWNSFYFQHFQ
jgi:hypothetical protein